MSEAPRGSLRDIHLDYRLKSFWINAKDYVTGATSTSAGPATLTCGYTGGAANTPLAMILPSGGISSMLWGAQIATTGATMTFAWRPSDFDNRHPLYIRHWWTTDGALASVATFNTAFATLTSGAAPASVRTLATRPAVGVAKAAVADALAMTRPAMIAPLATGANANQCFPYDTQVVNIGVSVSSLTNAALATDFCYLVGTELFYTPRQTFGFGSRRQARYIDPPLHDEEAPAVLDFTL